MRHILAAVLACVLLPVPLAAQSANGLWRTEATAEGHLEIRIAPCGAALCGVIERAVDPQGRTGPYPHLGRRMVWDMMPDGPGAWSGGKIWDPRRDRTFNSKMKRQGAALSVSGCFLAICDAQVWRAVD